MIDGSGPSSYNPHHGNYDEDDEDYEEEGEGNRLLGFMFGNVDGEGDLDADYLDEDAKEHLAALAEQLGSSLMDIDLSIKSSRTPADASEQDYGEKAENAVDYEDIDEQYEGPEVQATYEEDHVLSKEEYSSAGFSFSAMGQKTSVFDEENYDEDENLDEEEEQKVITDNAEAQDENLDVEQKMINDNSEAQPITSVDENSQLVFEEEKSFLDRSPQSFEEDEMAVDLEDFQEVQNDEGEQQISRELVNERSATPLPVLYVENGVAVLRFSEIFGIHEPLKKGEKKNRRYTTSKDRYKVIDAYNTFEEDEEAFLRGPCQGSVNTKEVSSVYDDSQVKVHNGESQAHDVWQGIVTESADDAEQGRNLCLSVSHTKESATTNLATEWGSLSPKFCPLDQQDWEDNIIWGDSPIRSPGSSESCIVSEKESECFNGETLSKIRPENSCIESQVEADEKYHHLFLSSLPTALEPLGSSKLSDHANHPFSERKHPQQLRLESCLKVTDSSYPEGGQENETNHLSGGGVMRNFSKLSLQNMDMLEDSWLDKIIWDSSEAVPKPKLILDLQDRQMLFEILETKDARDLQLHAGAMIVTRSLKPNDKDSFHLPGQVRISGGQFNISNDKYYSTRKTSQQLKSHSKKRTAHGVKILHSIPALKLQTMKPKLSNKDIANFHRPKALWYPHDNEVAAKEQGSLATQGPMKIILKNMGGKGSKFHVDAEETVISVKAKASKKMDFKPSEKVKIICSRKELDDSKSLAEENVRPNSVLHLVRTKIHLWPKAQKLPGGNKSLRPPGAFKKKSELSLKDGHAFLMEYCEERPLLLGNVGMGARLCTYYQKSALGDQTGASLPNTNSSLGHVLTLDPTDKSPFLGDIRPGCTQSSLETNMYRAPVFPHKGCSTDYLLVRSAKGKLSLRRIDRLYVVGQQEPHMEVMTPGTKNLQMYIYNRLLVYIYRAFNTLEKRGLLPCVRADELSAQFPISEPFIRKRLKHCADLQRGQNGQLFWVMKRNFRIPLELELRRMVTPENVCAYESMQAEIYRLKRLGINRLTHPTDLSMAMNQLPDEAITLAAASHIERELQITPWSLSSNFVACTNQDKESIERLEITGVGDPSGRGLGFSYVRVAPKAPLSNVVVKKKMVVNGGPTVTGTDADLRRLSMDAAREVLLKFNVPEEEIGKLTRWHRIAMIRRLSSEQAASGVKVDSTTINKYARGQRMSFLQLQQQTREKCQEIWDRQVQSLSAGDEDENSSDSEANSDLDSFAGDLENLLEAEECGVDEGNSEAKPDREDGTKGLKMRRHPSQPHTKEEIEDEAAEAAELCRMLMDEDETEKSKKKNPGSSVQEMGPERQSGLDSGRVEQPKKTGTIVKKIIRTPQPDGTFISHEQIITDPKEVESILNKRAWTAKHKGKKSYEKNRAGHMGKMNDGFKYMKEKKPTDKPVRENFICGACGQMGHMKTNKNCPRYGEDQSSKKLAPKSVTKTARMETSENSEKTESKTEVISREPKRGPDENISERDAPTESQNSDRHAAIEAETPKSKISRLVFSKKQEEVRVEPTKLVIKPPVEVEPPRKKIVIKVSASTSEGQHPQQSTSSLQETYRKTKLMSELSSIEKYKIQEGRRLAEGKRLAEEAAAAQRKAYEDRLLWEEEQKRLTAERILRERQFEEQMKEEQKRIAEMRRHEAIWVDEEEQQRSKKKKKSKRHEVVDDEYTAGHTSSRSEFWVPGRQRSAKRRSAVELEDYTPQSKRRRGGAGEVGLANILESVVDSLKDATHISYLFLKPVSKKEAPDYLYYIDHPMDLSTIKEKVRKMEYKHREDFRHDVWQITFNAHRYNDQRNPGIPPLADRLLELCDDLLDENDDRLAEAEAGIER